MTQSKPDLSSEELLYLRPTQYIDSDSREIHAFANAALAGMDPAATKTEIAIRLFDAVRDRVRYDPYSFALDAPSYRASIIADMDAAFCVPKAILLTACLRAAGIPAAVGFADVKNHLNTPKLADLMETDLFIYHGYVQLWLGGQTFKVTPAFNTELCQKFGVKPLGFDGHHDSLFHDFDENGRRHMEYVNDRGIFVDPPIDEFLRAFRETYPKLEKFNEDRIAGLGKVSDAFTDESPKAPA
ncbi:MAG: transglutaminase [Rhodobacteraceae bacterium]|nr:MAG: transglutaminase [Paracoccaceae bacterium]